MHVRGPLASPNAAFVHQMALAGHGVLLGPSLSFKDDFSAGRLIPLLSGWRSARALPVNVIYPHRALVSAKVRSFVDLLAERLGSGAERQQDRATEMATRVL